MKKRSFATIKIHTEDLETLRLVAEREFRSMAQQIRYWLEQDRRKSLSSAKQEAG